MQYKIFDIIMYLLEAGVFLYYASHLFQSRFSLPVRAVAVAVGHMALFGVYTIGNTWINMFSQVVIYVLLFYFIFGAKIKVAVLHAIIIPCILLISETIALSAVSAFMHKKFTGFLSDFMFYAAANLLSKILNLLFLSIIAGLFSKKNAVKNQNYWMIPAVIFLDAVVLMIVNDLFYMIEPTVRTLAMWIAVQVLILVLSGMFILNHYLVYKRAEEIVALRVEAQRNKVETQYLEVVEQSAKNMQLLSHDFKNHLIQLDNAADMEQVHEYIQSLYPTIRSFDSATVSDNATLNVIISKYNTLCAVKGVAFRYRIESALEHLEASDLSAILSNLLDNALEAAEVSEAKCIELRLFKKNEKLETLIITNSCDTAPIGRGGELLSSKSEPDTHTHTHTHTRRPFTAWA
ncbi:MAG: GHKL domain-containing protein [Ruminococcaceae bacterium]|nr:GHKL domain-containing protein [Oscillospiraceae bacterium]